VYDLPFEQQTLGWRIEALRLQSLLRLTTSGDVARQRNLFFGAQETNSSDFAQVQLRRIVECFAGRATFRGYIGDVGLPEHITFRVSILLSSV
jgi:hypothetical protein